MVNDPIGDMIIQLKNAKMAGIKTVKIPYSRVKSEIARILVHEGYLESAEKTGEIPRQYLQIALTYHGNEAVLTDVKRKSKPGLRVYVGKNMIPHVIGGMGIAIISTPSGIMTDREVRKKGVGGELLCEIW